ncbi:MAG: ribonuclease E inhibitor RraB [Casimicrobium sp.]
MQSENWPDDADGDVLRRMAARKFDFSKPYTIDFNIDFEVWPPPEEALRTLSKEFADWRAYEPDGDSPGYVLFQVLDVLSYERVVSVQKQATELMTPFGGVCESWGVLH